MSVNPDDEEEKRKLRESQTWAELSFVWLLNREWYEIMIGGCSLFVLGAMAFRLNELNKEKPEGSRTRGKRTIAKDHLYRHILSEIRTLKPAMNPKISTACEPFPVGSWSMPYRHWAFKPKP